MPFFPVRVNKQKSKSKAGKAVYNCSTCKLDQDCTTPVMKGYGNLKADIMIIGEAPGREEDKKGKLFIDKFFNSLGNCFITNVVRCRPQKDKTPTVKEIRCCSKFLQEDIQQVKPKVIILLGGTACKAILEDGTISKYRGYQIPSIKYNCYILPTYHPTKDWKYKSIITSDLSKVKLLKNKKLKLNDFTKDNTVLDKFDDVIDVLRSIRKDGLKFALDWETYPLRPYNKDSVIVSCGIAIGVNESYTFLMEGNWTDKQWEELKVEFKLLFNSDCPKVFFNYKFEKDWAVNRLDCDITGDIRDMMLVSYLEDSRKGTNSLDFQAFVNFGVGKIKEVSKYIKDMRKCPIPLLHDYQGRDARLTFALEEIKWIHMDADDKQHKIYYDLLLPGSNALLDSERGGVLIDKSVMKDVRSKLISKQIVAIKNLKDILKRNGIIISDTDQLNTMLNSPDQVSNFLFKILKLKPVKKTKTGFSVDQDVLESYKDESFCKSLLEYRGLTKLLSTYIDGLKDGIYDDGVLHPSFNVHLTGTGRLSGTNPNMQNIPKRKNRFIRKMFIAPKNHLIISFDYSGAEVRGMAMESKDKTLIKYIKEKYDMHQFWADRIKELTDRETTRHEGKNSFIFPSFYGASYKSIAKNLDIKESLCQQLQEELFEEFPGMKKYKETQMDFYDKNGYIESLFGRKRCAPLGYTQIINTPIQSLASDFTLLSLIETKKKGYRMCWTIHDDNSYYIPENKVESSYYEIKEIMTSWDFPFMNVPLEVECSVGENWFEMVDINEILGG